MLGVDEGGYAVGLLCFGDGVEGQGGLTRTFGTVNLDDTSAGEAANAEGGIEADAAGGDDIHFFHLLVAELHDRAFAVVFLNFGHSGLQGTEFVRHIVSALYGFFLCHGVSGVVLLGWCFQKMDGVS